MAREDTTVRCAARGRPLASLRLQPIAETRACVSRIVTKAWRCRARRAAGTVPGMSGRRAARRQALFLLYQWDLTGQQLASLYEGDVDPFGRQLAEEVIARAPDLDARITAAARDWTADRLGVVERNVLRIAITGARPRRGAARGRDRRSRPARETLCVGGCRRARQRHPRPHRARGRVRMVR